MVTKIIHYTLPLFCDDILDDCFIRSFILQSTSFDIAYISLYTLTKYYYKCFVSNK